MLIGLILSKEASSSSYLPRTIRTNRLRSNSHLILIHPFLYLQYDTSFAHLEVYLDSLYAREFLYY